MVGILAHGNNHFILSGPPPDDASALALARHFALIQNRREEISHISKSGEIRDKEFRENLEWAVVVEGDRPVSPGVAELLAELSARGIIIRNCRGRCW